MISVYIAASFKHLHGVRLLGRELRALGCEIHDWTEMASPPPGLTPAQRRVWMDTDREGGVVYSFCRDSCLNADLVLYYGASGQDAGVEVGLAASAGAPILGIRGPLEAPGLMLHGAVSFWVDSIEEAIELATDAVAILKGHVENAANPQASALAARIKARKLKKHIDANPEAS